MKRYHSINKILVLLLFSFIVYDIAQAQISKTFKDDKYHFTINFPETWSLKPGQGSNQLYRIVAQSPNKQEIILVSAIRTRGAGYSVNKAWNILLSWKINPDEINQKKFEELFESKFLSKIIKDGEVITENKTFWEGINVTEKEYKSNNGKVLVRYITKSNYGYAIIYIGGETANANGVQNIMNSFKLEVPTLNIWEQLTVLGFGVVVILIVLTIEHFIHMLFWYIGILGIWAILKGLFGTIYILFF